MKGGGGKIGCNGKEWQFSKLECHEGRMARQRPVSPNKDFRGAFDFAHGITEAYETISLTTFGQDRKPSSDLSSQRDTYRIPTAISNRRLDGA